MAELAGTVTPQGVLAVVTGCAQPLAEVLRPDARLVVLLAEVRDPGNAGTLIRAADAAGADAVILSEASVDVFNGKCVRASAGSIFHLPLAVNVALPDALATLRRAQLQILAADASGATSLNAAPLASPTGWIFGNEAHGLPEATRRLADLRVRVPIYGRAESLNLAAAAAVCLYASAAALRCG